MDSLMTEQTQRFLKFIPVLLWTIISGLFDWLIPGSWYAKDVREDVVLITGAGSGLGRAIALEYARLGSSLVMWDINEKGLRETKDLVEAEYSKMNTEKCQKYCSFYIVDVSDKNEVKKFAQKVYMDLNEGRNTNEPEKYVSVLVNNAGIYHGLMLQDLRDDQIERIFKINILAHFWTVRAFLPLMVKHERGHIVEIASMGGIAGLLKQVDYCATKFATVGFEESLSIELDHMGLKNKIRTTVICPFFFSSNLFTGFNTSIASLMTPQFVARETVMAMRCNHSRVLLPKMNAYALQTIKTFMPRDSIIMLTRAMGLAESIETIKGKAADVAVASC